MMTEIDDPKRNPLNLSYQIVDRFGRTVRHLREMPRTDQTQLASGGGLASLWRWFPLAEFGADVAAGSVVPHDERGPVRLGLVDVQPTAQGLVADGRPTVFKHQVIETSMQWPRTFRWTHAARLDSDRVQFISSRSQDLIARVPSLSRGAGPSLVGKCTMYSTTASMSPAEFSGSRKAH